MAASNLTLRVASAVVLAPAALAVTYFGEWPFGIFWTAAAVAVMWEWSALVDRAGGQLAFGAGAVAIIVSALMTEFSRPMVAILLIMLGAFAVVVFAPAARRLWMAAGLGYAGALALAPIFLRDDPQLGIAAILLVFIVVWATDIIGYFVGRAIGGPKLAPSISPKKTWSGALAGTLGAVMLAALFAPYAGVRVIPVVAIAFSLSIASQAGDLLESAVKRHFDAKDAGTLIPGHGGVMDRLDGFWAAICVATSVGILRGGFEAPAQGLLVW